MASYHETATPTVAFNPYLPAIGRVLEVLRSYGPHATIEINNRDLASAAGLRSAGHIPQLLRNLEADGYIERVTSPQGTLITVLYDGDLIPHGDRSFEASGCDQGWDQPPATDPTWDQQNPTATRDQAKKRPDERSRMADPPCIPNMVLSMSDQQQQLRAPLWYALIAAGAAPSVARAILDKNPELTLAAFKQLCNAASTRGSRKSEKSIGLVFYCLQRGESLHTPKESTSGRQHAQNQPRRSERDSRRDAAALQAQPPALQPGDLARLPKRGAVSGVSG